MRASDRDGDPEVFTMRADGNDPVNLTQNHRFDAAPDWQPLPTTAMTYTTMTMTAER